MIKKTNYLILIILSFILLSCASKKDVPMWIGWNAFRETLNKSTRSILHLPQITQSPTSIAAVAETLKKAVPFASQSGKLP